MSLTDAMQLPADRARGIQRRLQPYDKPEEDALTDVEFYREHLYRETNWYALLSAEGSGKTSFLHWLQNPEKFPLQSGPSLTAPQTPAIIVCSPFDCSKFRDAPQRKVLGAIYAHILDSLQIDDNPLTRPIEQFPQRVTLLAQKLQQRIIILLDNFHELRQAVAHDLAAILRDIFQASRRHITIILAANNDLRTINQDTSPLKNIVTTYKFPPIDGNEFIRLYRQASSVTDTIVTNDAHRELWKQTRGFPYLLWAVFEGCKVKRRLTASDIQEASQPDKNELVEGWLSRQKASLDIHANSIVLSRLRLLIENKKPVYTHAGIEMLWLHGIVRQVEHHATWHNTIVENYFKAQPLKTLHKELRASGKIYVTLALNFRHFVKDKAFFDQLRGSDSYQQLLDALHDYLLKRPTSDSNEVFAIDPNNEKLIDIAADLNIMRFQSAQTAFVPIYQLPKIDRGSPIGAQEDTDEPADSNLADLLPHFQQSSTLDERLPPEITEPERNEFLSSVQEQWHKWEDKSIQLTRDGLALVRLGRMVNDKTLVDVAKDVTGLEDDPISIPEPREWRKFREQLDRSVQWEIVMALIEKFIGTCFEPCGDEYFFPQGKVDPPDSQLEVPPDSQLEVRKKLRLCAGGIREEPENGVQEESIYPLHDRYVYFVFNRLCDCAGVEAHGGIKHHVISSSDLLEEENEAYAGQLHSLLEGILVSESGREGDATFPSVTKQAICEMLKGDLSTWEDELCLLSNDNGVIYYSQNKPSPEQASDDLASADSDNPNNDDPTTMRCGLCTVCLSNKVATLHFSTRKNIAYSDYWECIIKGLDYILNLRLLALLVATTSTRDLETIADLEKDSLGQDTLGRNGDFVVVQELRGNVSTNTRLLGHLRDVVTPLFMARADYATAKFDYFIQIGGLTKTIANAENDIQAINAFLQHYDSYINARQTIALTESIALEQTQREVLRDIESSRLSRIALFTLLFTLLLLPSFYIDLEESRLGSELANWSLAIIPSIAPYDLVSLIEWTTTIVVIVIVVSVLFSFASVSVKPYSQRLAKRFRRSLPGDNFVKLTGAEKRELYECLLGAFTYSSFKRMLVHRLERDLRHVILAGDFADIIFELVEQADREDWTLELIREAHKANSSNRRLAQFYHRYIPTG